MKEIDISDSRIADNSDPLKREYDTLVDQKAKQLKPVTILSYAIAAGLVVGCSRNGGTPVVLTPQEPFATAYPTQTAAVAETVALQNTGVSPAVELELSQNEALLTQEDRRRLLNENTPNESQWQELVNTNQISQTALDSYAQVQGSNLEGGSGALLLGDGFVYLLTAGHVVQGLQNSENISVSRGLYLPNFGIATLDKNEYGITFINYMSGSDDDYDIGAIAIPLPIALQKLSPLYDFAKIMTLNNVYSGQDETGATYSGLCSTGGKVRSIVSASVNPVDPPYFPNFLNLDNAVVGSFCSGGEIWVNINGVFYYRGSISSVLGSQDPVANQLLADNVEVSKIEAINNFGGLENFLDKAALDYRDKN